MLTTFPFPSCWALSQVLYLCCSLKTHHSHLGEMEDHHDQQQRRHQPAAACWPTAAACSRAPPSSWSRAWRVSTWVPLLLTLFTSMESRLCFKSGIPRNYVCTMYITTSKMFSYFTYLDHPCWKYNRWNDSKKSSFFTICNVDCAVILRETPFFDLRHPEQRNNTNIIINLTNNCNNFCIQSCAWDQRRGLAEKYCIARRFNGLFSLLSSESSSADPPLSSAV